MYIKEYSEFLELVLSTYPNNILSKSFIEKEFDRVNIHQSKINVLLNEKLYYETKVLIPPSLK